MPIAATQNVAFYDLEVSPCTFDCIKFYLLASLHYANQSNTGFTLYVVPPTPKRLTALLATYNSTAQSHLANDFFTTRITNILVAAAELIPGLNSVTILEKREHAAALAAQHSCFPPDYNVAAPAPVYGIREVLRIMRQGHVLPSLKPPEAVIESILYALFGNKKTATITLRQCQYQPLRNSDLDAYQEFSAYLQQHGFHVFIIPDPESDTLWPAPLDDISREAVNNVVYRACLYATCNVNFFVNSGSAALARFNHNAIFVSHKLVVEDYGSTSRAFWLGIGVVPGQQLSFLSPLQLQCWETDSLTNLTRHFADNVSPLLALSPDERTTLVRQWYAGILVPQHPIPSAPEPLTADVNHCWLWAPAAQREYWTATLSQKALRIAGYLDSYQFGRAEYGLKVIHPSQFTHSDDIVVIAGQTPKGDSLAALVLPEIALLYPTIRRVATL
jgi:hypothetical protein